MYRGRENLIRVNITKQDKGELFMANNLIILIAAVERNAIIQFPSQQEEIFLSLFGKLEHFLHKMH